MVRSSISLVAVLASLAGAAHAFAVQHLVRAGDEWSKLQAKLQPGDEVVLMPGKHRPAAFENLSGTADKPIVIRSADPKVPITIDASDVGISLKGVNHVHVRGVVVVNARRCGFLVQGSAEHPCTNVELNTVYVAKTGDLAERAGIWIAQASDVTVLDSRIEGWHRAGIHLHGAERVRLERVQFVGIKATPEEYAVAIDGRSSDITMSRCQIAAGIGTVAAIGLAATETPPPAQSGGETAEVPKSEPVYLAEQVTVDHCVAERIKQLAAFGSCRNVQILANTVSEVEVAYQVTAPPKGYGRVANATFMANLVTWTPGEMKRFSAAAPDVDPTGLVLETNLWWSAELPAAKPLLGDMVGTIRSPQVMDIDPRLDGYLKPLNEAARAFGTEAP